MRKFLIYALLLLLAGCSGMDPRNVDVEIQEEIPRPKITSFDKALSDLGRMSRIYGNGLRIQSEYIADNTGTSVDSKSGIPKDITEMIKSALNAIGGEVVYIPYNPSFINNQMLTGYSEFEHKVLPDVILSGGITEFDQNFEVRSSSTDIAATTQPFNIDESWVPVDTIEIGYSKSGKRELSRITLDFNLVDFKTLVGISKVQTVNTVVVQKATAEKELAFTLFGPTFGLDGSVSKVQGRHAAIRLMVQLSVVQIVGKYLLLPYWKLLPGAEPDKDVLEKVALNQSAMSPEEQIKIAQVSLFFQGKDIEVDGTLNPATVAALKEYDPEFDPSRKTISQELHMKLWELLGNDLDQGLVQQKRLTKRMREQSLQQEVIADDQQNLAQPVEKESAAGVVNQEKTSMAAPEDSQQAAQETPEIEKSRNMRQKATQDAMFRLLKKLSVWGEEK